MWNGLNCSRCGLYSAGESSICEVDYYPGRETRRIEYEIDFEKTKIPVKDEKIYCIMSGYGSRFDMAKIYLTQAFKDEVELRQRFLWITDIGEKYNNLCDDCVKEMLFYKEARAEDFDHFIQSFYTACCGKYIEKTDKMGEFYKVEKVKRFPYISYYSFSTWEDEYTLEPEMIRYSYIRCEDAFFTYHPYCTVCQECFNKFGIKTEMLSVKPHPVLYTLGCLRGGAEIYLGFKDRETMVLTRHSCDNPHTKKDYVKRFYWYQNKKNMLALKTELSRYIVKRNLCIIQEYIFISKDVFNLIVNCV